MSGVQVHAITVLRERKGVLIRKVSLERCYYIFNMQKVYGIIQNHNAWLEITDVNVN
jgi:hypothetical protein